MSRGGSQPQIAIIRAPSEARQTESKSHPWASIFDLLALLSPRAPFLPPPWPISERSSKAQSALFHAPWLPSVRQNHIPGIPTLHPTDGPAHTGTSA